jgi:hypothetical protein
MSRNTDVLKRLIGPLLAISSLLPVCLIDYVRIPQKELKTLLGRCLLLNDGILSRFHNINHSHPMENG